MMAWTLKFFFDTGITKGKASNLEILHVKIEVFASRYWVSGLFNNELMFLIYYILKV